MPTILELADQFRREIARRQAAASARLLAAYLKTWDGIEADLTKLAERVEAARADGVEASPAWELQRERLEAIKAELSRKILDIADAAAVRAEAAQGGAVEAARRHVEKQIAAAARPAGISIDFRRLGDDRLKEFVGFLGDGSTLKKSFERLAADIGLKAASTVEDAITRGIGLGHNPARIVALIRERVDNTAGNPFKDPEIVRRLKLAVHTSVIYSAREATREGYKVNGLTRWQWSCSRTATTCPACWALDGKIFEIDTPHGGHPNCKCTLLPILDDAPDDAPTGPEVFAGLTETTKRSILGDLLYRAYKDGRLDLADTVGKRENDYGTQYGTRSLADILGETVARRYYFS